MDPRIHLAIDNCFAIKRWVTPVQWAHVIRELGIRNVECVTDVDNEPLLMHPGYLEDWLGQTREAMRQYDMNVVMLYSGNSTYDTTGLAHPDARVRRHIIEQWFGRFIDMAAALGTSIGYFVHGLPEDILLDKARYDAAVAHTLEGMVEINRMAAARGIPYVALEQMYTPHQPPFTIQKMREVMRYVGNASGKDLHFTEDVGHHSAIYIRPDEERLRDAHLRRRMGKYPDIWLGSAQATQLFDAAAHEAALPLHTINAILRDAEQNDHLFAAAEDTDTYNWLRSLGCYSPVIHLQQTDGTFSSHKPFTPKNNTSGIISPHKVLEVLRDCYAAPQCPGMPARCEDIYLTLEVYASTKDMNGKVLYQLKQSVDHLRRAVPRDGMRLSELVSSEITA